MWGQDALEIVCRSWTCKGDRSSATASVLILRVHAESSWWLSLQDKDVIYYVTAYNENMPMPEKPEAGRETCTYVSVLDDGNRNMLCSWWMSYGLLLVLRHSAASCYMDKLAVSLPSWFHEFFDSAAGSRWRHCQRTVQVFWCKASRPQGTAARCHTWVQIWFGMELFMDLRSTDDRFFQTLCFFLGFPSYNSLSCISSSWNSTMHAADCIPTYKKM